MLNRTKTKAVTVGGLTHESSRGETHPSLTWIFIGGVEVSLRPAVLLFLRSRGTCLKVCVA